MTQVQSVNFKDMDIGKLRQYASHLRLPIAKTAKKEEIIEAIDRKLKNRTVAEIADDTSVLKPGYARIIVLADPMPDAANNPVFINENGYVATLPRGVEIIVPYRVVRNLTNAKVRRKKQSMVADASGREIFTSTEVVVPSYPFQMLEHNPGPDILTAHEQNKLRTAGPKRRYRELFGRYPRPKELTRAIEQKLISLDDGDYLDKTTEALLGTDVEA